MKTEDVHKDLSIPPDDTSFKSPMCESFIPLEEYKFIVKSKESSFITLKWKQFQNMTVHKFTHHQNIDKNILVIPKKKNHNTWNRQ